MSSCDPLQRPSLLLDQCLINFLLNLFQYPHHIPNSSVTTTVTPVTLLLVSTPFYCPHWYTESLPLPTAVGMPPSLSCSWDSVMSIVTDYGLSGPGFKPWRGKIFCSCPDWLWGPPCLLYSRYWLSFPGVKWPGYDVYHPPHLLNFKKG